MLELRNQVYSLTIATIMQCNKPPQNSVAKSKTLFFYSASTDHLGQLCFIWHVSGSGSSPWPFILPELEGLPEHVLFKTMAKVQEVKKKHPKPPKSSTINWYHHSSSVSLIKQEAKAKVTRQEVHSDCDRAMIIMQCRKTQRTWISNYFTPT